jgi:hypothetical protein
LIGQHMHPEDNTSLGFRVFHAALLEAVSP